MFYLLKYHRLYYFLVIFLYLNYRSFMFTSNDHYKQCVNSAKALLALVFNNHMASPFLSNPDFIIQRTIREIKNKEFQYKKNIDMVNKKINNFKGVLMNNKKPNEYYKSDEYFIHEIQTENNVHHIAKQISQSNILNLKDELKQKKIELDNLIKNKDKKIPDTKINNNNNNNIKRGRIKGKIKSDYDIAYEILKFHLNHKKLISRNDIINIAKSKFNKNKFTIQQSLWNQQRENKIAIIKNTNTRGVFINLLAV